MGIKGTVRRSTDGDFIHANVDIDLIIDEEPVVSNILNIMILFQTNTFNRLEAWTSRWRCFILLSTFALVVAGFMSLAEIPV